MDSTRTFLGEFRTLSNPYPPGYPTGNPCVDEFIGEHSMKRCIGCNTQCYCLYWDPKSELGNFCGECYQGWAHKRLNECYKHWLKLNGYPDDHWHNIAYGFYEDYRAFLDKMHGGVVPRVYLIDQLDPPMTFLA